MNDHQVLTATATISCAATARPTYSTDGSPAERSSSEAWKRTPSAREHRRRPERCSCGTFAVAGPNPVVDRRMLFLLATAKLNQAERFGVGLGETYGLNSGEDLPPERVYMELEEHYHTRLLAYVAGHLRPALPGGRTAARHASIRQDRRIPPRAERVSCSWAPRKWRAASCSTSYAASESSCSPTSPRSPRGSSGCTARSSPTKWVTSATARRDAPPAERAVMRRLYPRIGRLFARQTFEISLLTDREELHDLLDRPFDVDPRRRSVKRNIPRRPPLTVTRQGARCFAATS